MRSRLPLPLSQNLPNSPLATQGLPPPSKASKKSTLTGDEGQKGQVGKDKGKGKEVKAPSEPKDAAKAKDDAKARDAAKAKEDDKVKEVAKVKEVETNPKEAEPTMKDTDTS